MSHKAARIGITGLVLVLAFGGLLYSTLSEGTEYYKHVDEVLASPQEWQGKRLQVHGYAKNVSRKPNKLEYRFDQGTRAASGPGYRHGQRIRADDKRCQQQVVPEWGHVVSLSRRRPWRCWVCRS